MYVEKFQPYVGKPSALLAQTLSADEIKRFAIATRETDPVYLDEEYAKTTPYGGIIAPPTYAKALTFPAVEGLPMPSRGRVHAEQEFVFYKPMRAGDTVYCRNTVAEVYEKQGRAGAMVFIKFENAVLDENGEPYSIGYSTTLLRQAVLDNPEFYKPRAAGVQRAEWLEGIPTVDPAAIAVGDEVGPFPFPQMTRTMIAQWASATGDYNSIHFEEDAAVAAGMGGTIAHGMIGVSLMGGIFTAWLNGKGRMTGLKVRFSAPVRAGDTLSASGTVTELEKTEAGTRVVCDMTVTTGAGAKALVMTLTAQLD